jgi:hypothetical protein
LIVEGSTIRSTIDLPFLRRTDLLSRVSARPSDKVGRGLTRASLVQILLRLLDPVRIFAQATIGSDEHALLAGVNRTLHSTAGA